MYIVDRNKDFYDYLSHIYGVDKNIVFDRRGSLRITDDALVFDYRNSEDHKLLFIEIGEAHYLIKLSNLKFKKDLLLSIFEVKSFDIEILHKYNTAPNQFGSPISIHAADNYRWLEWNWRSWRNKQPFKINIPSFDEVIRYTKDNDTNIILPILQNTSLTKVLDATTVWVEIQTYISSLDNDRDIDLNTTDKEKAIIHGFDEKSFRHPIK